MKYTLIAVSSITYAMKAKKLLNSAGYFCEVEKTPKNFSTGCGYSIKINVSPDKIIRLLTENGIIYKDIMTLER